VIGRAAPGAGAPARSPRATLEIAVPRSRGAAFVLSASQWVPLPPDRTFAFFADAGNLERITPPFLGFAILTPLPIAMGEGTLIEYRLRMMGVPMGWLTRIESWEPGRSFVDVQLRGPYTRWRHQHTFQPADGGTWVRDRVEYALPFAPWSRPVHPMFVRPALERIFTFRRHAIRRLLG
jgi:ligand-binding SRPBCC domain-containing protein